MVRSDIVEVTVALDAAHDGAFRAGEAWGRACFYLIIVFVLVQILRRRLRRRRPNTRDAQSDDRA